MFDCGITAYQAKEKLENNLNFLPSRPTGRPSPLEVIAPQPSCDIHHFTNEIKPWNLFAFHRFGRKFVRIHAPTGDLGFGITDGGFGDKSKILDFLAKILKFFVRQGVDGCSGWEFQFAQAVRQTGGNPFFQESKRTSVKQRQATERRSHCPKSHKMHQAHSKHTHENCNP